VLQRAIEVRCKFASGRLIPNQIEDPVSSSNSDVMTVRYLLDMGAEVTGPQWAGFVQHEWGKEMTAEDLAELIRYLKNSKEVGRKRGRKRKVDPAEDTVTWAVWEYEEALAVFQRYLDRRRRQASERGYIRPKAELTANELALAYIAKRYPQFGSEGTVRNLISKNRKLRGRGLARPTGL
jgi:hypothetical protein